MPPASGSPTAPRKTAASASPRAAKTSRPAAPKKQTKAQAEAEAARIAQILDILDKLYPDAHCELYNWDNAEQLLVAVILSAQCTDERVNKVTPELFKRFPDAAALAKADPDELEKLIHSTGFYRNKAKNVRAAAKMLVEKFGGKVPKTMDQVLKLPGVARKTGNVVLGTAYGIPTGVVVDTHIGRLSQRLGMSAHEDPVKIEADLMKAWPQERWIMSGHRLIWHGRRVCFARKPNCSGCELAPLCPSAELAAELPSAKTPASAKTSAKSARSRS